MYGEFTNSHVLQKDQIIQIVVNNLDSGRHPFHLHGHQFQAIHRSAADEGTFDDTNTTMTNFPKIPMRRDTLSLEPNGNLVLRFKADNPGKPFLPQAPQHKGFFFIVVFRNKETIY